MGLDIYFERYENKKAVDAAVLAYKTEKNRLREALCKKHGISDIYELSDNIRQQFNSKSDFLAISLGLETGGLYSAPCIELPSNKYPDHLFKIGYSRSSYNDFGINNILRANINKDLYWIFGYNKTKEENVFKPDWAKVRKRAQQAINELNQMVSRYGSIMKAEACYFRNNGPKNAAEAVQVVISEIDKRRTEFESKSKEQLDFLSYSNSTGIFHLNPAEPINVCGTIGGTITGGNFSFECVWTVSRENADWYIQALEIVIESVDYVFSLPLKEQKKIWVFWCG